MSDTTFPVPVGTVDDEYLARLAKAVMAEWRPAEPLADLLLSLTDEQSAALLAWSGTGLRDMIVLQDAIQGDTSNAVERLRGLGAAIGFWHESRVTPCVRMLTRDPRWRSARLLFAKMVREGPDWTRSVVNGLLKPRTNDIRGIVGALLSAIRHFDLPLPENDRFLVVWAETFADLPDDGWLWTLAPDGGVVAEESVGPDGLFARTPHLELLVCRVVGSPNALQPVHVSEELPTTAFSGAVARAVASGRLDRQPVLDAVLDALDSTGYPPAAQRVLANLLRGLELTKDDVVDNLPRMVSLLGVGSSMAATMLWERLAGMDLGPDDLLEVGTVLLSRKEKKLWEAVVGYLVRLPQSSPLVSTAVELCTLATLLDDRAVAARARAFVEQHAPDEAVPVADAVEVLPWELPPPKKWRKSWNPRLDPGETTETRAVGLGERFRYDYQGVALPGVADEWKDRPAGGTLLCLPTYSDWTITFDDLLARVKAAQDEGYWPHDLAQALLRLEPTDPARAAELDGLTLPAARDMDASSPLRTRGGGYIAEWIKKQSDGDLPDGVELIRTWVAAGGITIPEATFDDVGDTVLPDLKLPVLVPGVRAMRKLTGNGDVWPGGLATMPLAVEYLCSCGRATHKASSADWDKAYRHWLCDHDRIPVAKDYGVGRISKAHGPFGRATYGYLALRFVQPEARVQDVVKLVQQGRFDPSAFVEALRYLNALPSDVESGFSLVRFAARCDEVAQTGALHGIWPVLTAMAVTAVTSPKIPTGTLDVLRVANQYVPTVAGHLPPDEVVPPEVRVFAASKSKTKAALEARAWLDAALAAGVTFSQPAPVAPAAPPAVSAPFDKVWPEGAGTLPAAVDGATLTVEWRDPSVQVKALRFDLALPDRPDERFVVVRSVTRGNDWTYDLEWEGQCWVGSYRVGESPTQFDTWLHWDADTGRLVTTEHRNWVDGNDEPLPHGGKPPALSTTLVAVVLGLTAQDHDRDRRDGEELVAALVEKNRIGSAAVRVAVGQLLEHPEVDPARLVRQLAKKPALLPTLWPLLTESVRVAGATDAPPPRWLARVLDAAITYAPTLREAATRGLLPADAATWPGLADLAARSGKSAAITKARTLIEALDLAP